MSIAGSATPKASKKSIEGEHPCLHRIPKNECGRRWGTPAARDPVLDGEGWGRDRTANLLMFVQRALAVVVDGGGSPSDTQELGLCCD